MYMHRSKNSKNTSEYNKLHIHTHDYRIKSITSDTFAHTITGIHTHDYRIKSITSYTFTHTITGIHTHD